MALQSIRNGVKQAKLSVAKIDEDSAYRERIQQKAGWQGEIHTTQPVVLVNHETFCGLHIEDIPIVSAGYLGRVLRGAKIRLRDKRGRVIRQEQAIAGEYVTNEELIQLLYEPYVWRMLPPDSGDEEIIDLGRLKIIYC